MTRVAHCYERYYPQSGGVETHLNTLLDFFNEEMIIISDAHNDIPIEDYYDPNRVKLFNPTSTNIRQETNLYYKIKFPHRVINDIFRMKNKTKYIITEDIDLCVVHGMNLGHNLLKFGYMFRIKSLLASIASLEDVNFPRLLTLHGLYNLSDAPRYFQNLELRIVERFDNILCVDEAIATFMMKKFPNKDIYCIPNPINCKKFPYSTIDTSSKPTIGFIGRAAQERGIDILKLLLKEADDDIRIILVLNGPQSKIDVIKKYPTKAEVHVHSNINNDQVHQLLTQMDILFNPVLIEGISRVTLEAMSCGRPVVMIDIGNRYPVVDDSTGLIIQPTQDEVIRIINIIKENREKIINMGRNAGKVIRNEFDSEILCPRIKNIYTSIIEK